MSQLITWMLNSLLGFKVRSNSFLNSLLEIDTNIEAPKNQQILLDRNSSRFKRRFENSVFGFCPIARQIYSTTKINPFCMPWHTRWIWNLSFSSRLFFESTADFSRRRSSGVIWRKAKIRWAIASTEILGLLVSLTVIVLTTYKYLTQLSIFILKDSVNQFCDVNHIYLVTV